MKKSCLENIISDLGNSGQDRLLKSVLERFMYAEITHFATDNGMIELGSNSDVLEVVNLIEIDWGSSDREMSILPLGLSYELWNSGESNLSYAIILVRDRIALIEATSKEDFCKMLFSI